MRKYITSLMVVMLAITVLSGGVAYAQVFTDPNQTTVQTPTTTPGAVAPGTTVTPGTPDTGTGVAPGTTAQPFTPGTPDTGAGGNSAINLILIGLSLAVLTAGAVYLWRKQTA
jgi:LPXTG-motif cell wall-anchored protein